MVKAKVLQRQLTPQTSIWSMLGLQDNPLMPVIITLFSRKRLEWHSPINSGESIGEKYSYTAPFPFYNLSFSFKATDWSPSGACWMSLPGDALACIWNQLVMAGYVMLAAAFFQTALVSPSLCQLQGWDTKSFGSSVFIKQHRETLLF